MSVRTQEILIGFEIEQPLLDLVDPLQEGRHAVHRRRL